MTNKNPIYPFKNLFITARPGMGSTTLALNIVSKFLDVGKKCLIYQTTDYFFTNYIERMKCIKENIAMKNLAPCFQKYGNLIVILHHFFSVDYILEAVEEHDADIIVFEEPNRFWNQTKELIKLTNELKKLGKTFIFVTHIKNSKYGDKSKLMLSRHRKAIRHFDATAIVNRTYFDNIEEIRVYKKNSKRCVDVPVHFDFPKHKVSLK